MNVIGCLCEQFWARLFVMGGGVKLTNYYYILLILRTMGYRLTYCAVEFQPSFVLKGAIVVTSPLLCAVGFDGGIGDGQTNACAMCPVGWLCRIVE